MTERPPPAASKGPQNKRVSGILPVVISALAIWAAWQVIRAPLANTLAPELAVRLAPSSADVLQRASQDALVQGRADVARDFAKLSLSQAPFSAAALRVLGLSLAAQDTAQADQILTLAGNLSLRDTPTHGWLVEHRLKQGDYRSAIAHADTLARRNTAAQAGVFDLFTAAAALDPRVARIVIERLAVQPGWRAAYLGALSSGPKANPSVLAAIIVGLQDTTGPLSDVELSQVYGAWVSQGRIPAVRAVRELVDRPAISLPIVNGSFEGPTGAAPFAWTVNTAPGLVASIEPHPSEARQQALQVDYDNFSSAEGASQLLLLPAGAGELRGKWRSETGGEMRLSWKLTCLESGTEIARISPASDSSALDVPIDVGTMRTFVAAFSVPTQGCTAQRLSLVGEAGDRRRPVSVWFDDISIHFRR